MVEGATSKIRTVLMCFLHKWLCSRGNKLGLSRSGHSSGDTEQLTVGDHLIPERSSVHKTSGISSTDNPHGGKLVTGIRTGDKSASLLHSRSTSGRRCAAHPIAKPMDNDGQRHTKPKPNASVFQPSASRAESSQTSRKGVKSAPRAKSKKSTQSGTNSCTAGEFHTNRGGSSSRRNEAAAGHHGRYAASSASSASYCQFPSHVINSYDGERGYIPYRREVENANKTNKLLDGSNPPPNKYPFGKDNERERQRRLQVASAGRRDSAPPPYALAQQDQLVPPPSYDTLVTDTDRHNYDDSTQS